MCISIGDQAVDVERGGRVFDISLTAFLGGQIYSVNRSKPATARRLAQLKEMGEPFLPLTKPLEFTIQKFEDYEAAAKKYPREPEN